LILQGVLAVKTLRTLRALRRVAVANLDRCAAPCPRLRPAIPPALKLENVMRKTIRSLNVRSAGGHIESKADTFTSGFVRETAQGYTSVSDDAVIDAALELLSQRIAKGPLLASPRAVKDYLRLRFADLQHEVFCLLYLDKRHRLIACEDIFRGTIDGASVHPREVVKAALRHNAAAVICAHNHPSHNAEPSHADELITSRLKEVLSLVDIRLLDHLVVSAVATVSLAERGVL
jgi:DNA repair protein RadC